MLRVEWLAEHETAVAELTAERDALRLEFEQATTAIAGREATIDGLEQQLAAGAAELEQLAASKTESQRLATERLRQQELREEEQNAALAAQLALAQTAVAEHDQLIKERRVASGELTERLSAAEAVAEQVAAERDALVTRVELLETELKSSGQRLAEGARTVESLRGRLQAVAAANSDLEGRVAALASADGEREQLALQGADLQRELSSARDTLAIRDTSLRAAETTVEQLETRLAGLLAVAGERDEVAGRLAELEILLSAEQGAAEQLRAARAALDVVRAERDRIATTADDYAAQSKRYATALFELQDWSDQAEAELARLGAEAAARKTKGSRREEPLRRQLANVQGGLETAGTALEDERRARVSALAAAEELRVELAEARTRESTFDRRLAEVGAEGAAQSQRQAQQAAATVAQLRRRLAVLTSELTGLRQREVSRPELPAVPPSVVVPAEPLAVVESQDRELLVEVAEPIAVAAAPAASSAPVSAREPRPDPGLQVVEAVQRWARAWSQQDVSGYLAAYAGDYRPANGLDHAAWARQRRERLTGPRFIEVALDRMAVDVTDARRARVEFEQSYRSDGFDDRVIKMLELVRIDSVWKIVSEVSR